MKVLLSWLCVVVLLVCPIQGARVTKTKVLILGAGAAGVTAASTLYENGEKDFLVLEGQDYIGGRMKQKEFFGVMIEEGANWIHGATAEDENPLYDIMKKYKFRGIFSNYDDFIVRDPRGANITDGEVTKRYKKIMRKLDRLSVIRDESHDISIKEAERLVGWVAETPMEKSIERYKIDFEYAMPSSKASFNGWGYYDTDFIVIDPRGYGVFLKDMVKPFRNKVLLEKTVTSIQRFRRSVRVTTKDGAIYDAEYVLSTFSNNVLLSDMIKVRPPLPRFKKDSMRKVQMADYTKIWLKFPKKFWDDREFILYASDIDGGHFHTWQDLERPGILPPGSAVLMMTCTDEISRRIEAQTDEETLKEIMGILRGVYGQDIPEADGIFYSRWSQNPYTRGAYSNSRLGASSADFGNIASTVGRIFFAGDGTTYDLFGYVHGALATGKEKAKQILACIADKPYPACPVYPKA